MTYLPKPNEGSFELAPAGTHLAMCYRVVDLGTQLSRYNGQERQAHKILISWELQDETMHDGRPFTIGQRYTWSMSEKATLRKHLESWRGVAFTDRDFGPTGFHIKNIIGKGCLLTIAHRDEADKHYANITAVSKLMRGMTPSRPPINPQLYLWLDPMLYEESTFLQLSNGIQETIRRAPEYTALQAPIMIDGNAATADREVVAEEIPF